MKLIKFEKIEVNLKKNNIFKNMNFSLEEGDFVGIYGANGMGKSIFAETLSGNMRITSGKVYKKEGIKIAVVSSYEKNRMLEADRYNDDSQFMHGKTDPGRSVATILGISNMDKKHRKKILDNINMAEIEPILDRGIRFLSTGEFRKMILIGAMLSKADVIILDDPYTGLDIDTRKKLEIIIGCLIKDFSAVVIISGRVKDIEKCNKHFLIEKGYIKKCRIKDFYTSCVRQNNSFIEKESFSQKEIDKNFKIGKSLIRMNNVKMLYYDEKILTDINWEVRAGEHWQIIGPNGSGKSSLVSLVNGDSPKAYNQEIFLFDKKRGSGETVWEIKQKIGLVSGHLQRMHRTDQSVLSIVVSGFFDTVGLYDKPNPVQIEEAKKWCKIFGVDSILNSKFNTLSEGQKRRVLIIRALIKRPKILILDEPCQGLDDNNSFFVLETASQIIKDFCTTLIYISHDPFYRLDGIDCFMQLVPHNKGGYTAVVNKRNASS